ncbi:hypothetical protein [Staphylococcus phage vB_StaM_SA1]|nr:hypothetical protein [Staphylococcus phage vB_StaM_SA1]
MKLLALSILTVIMLSGCSNDYTPSKFFEYAFSIFSLLFSIGALIYVIKSNGSPRRY